MSPLWLGAAAALFVLLHLAVAAYLYRSAAADGPDHIGEYIPAQVDERPTGAAADEPADERVPCPACGVPNDPSYRFCRRCVADLSAGLSSSAGGDGGKRLGS